MRGKLFWSSRSPFARKVTVAAHEAGWIDRLDLVPTVAMTSRPDAGLAAINPLVKLPTLILENGTALYDSHVICRWIDLQADIGLFPVDPHRLIASLRREALADGALEAMLALRAEERRPVDHRNIELIAAYRARVLAVIDAIEREADDWTKCVDIGTIGIAVLLAYLDFRAPELTWRDGRPRTASCFAAVAARPSMIATDYAD